MALTDMIQQKSFLGTEFTTWLWYRSETDDGTIELDEGRACELEFEKDLVLASEAGQALASSLRGESPALAPEAVAALEAGKKVRRARVTLTVDSAAWQLTLNGETFDWGSLKIDTPPSLPFDEAVPVRLSALEGFQRIFSQLYGRFLDVRLDAERWNDEMRAMRRWVRSKATPQESAEQA